MSTCEPHMPDASASGSATSESRIEENRTEDGLTENLQDQGDSLTSVDARVACARIIAEFEARHNDTDLMLGPSRLRQREWAGLRLATQIIRGER